MCTHEKVHAWDHEGVDAGEDCVGVVYPHVSPFFESLDTRVYVQPILANATGVTITTMKLKIQLAVVAIAFAGARISKGVISAG